MTDMSLCSCMVTDVTDVHPHLYFLAWLHENVHAYVNVHVIVSVTVHVCVYVYVSVSVYVHIYGIYINIYM